MGDMAEGFQMMRKAFPSSGIERIGMSLRDYFAAKAIAGLCVECAGMLSQDFYTYAKGPPNVGLAERAYAIADAMLKEREGRE